MSIGVSPETESAQAGLYDGFVSYSHAADGLLAPRLQSGLQRFAKPWWKRRALRVFRDESSLSANPHLWSSITQALDKSAWFVLLLSPDAARSEWVNQEIEYWREHKDPSRILPVLTDGAFEWTGDDVAGSAVPEQLEGAFSAEPRWVDLRFAQDEEQLDLKNSRFSAAVADVASALRGIPKDELESEEVKQHRRNIRTAWAAASLVGLLGIAATVFAMQSASNAALAEARELAASAVNVLDSDPELSILLALESLRVAPEDEAELFESTVALRRAMKSQNLIRRIPLPETSLVGALSPDGSHYLWTADETRTHRMLDLRTGEELWSSEPGVNHATFSNDGQLVAYGVSADVETPARVVMVDTVSGEIVNQAEIPGCRTVGQWGGSQSPDGTMWAFASHAFDDCNLGAEEAASNGEDAESALLLFDSDSLEIVATVPVDFATETVSWLPDGNRVVVTVVFRGSKLIDLASGETLAESPEGAFWSHTISPDGSLVAAAIIAEPAVWLFDTEMLTRVDLLTGLPDGVEGMRFSQDGRLLIAGTRSEKVIAWDPESGEAVHVMTQTGPGWSVDLDPDTQHLYVLAPQEISIWDLSGARQGEFGSVDINAWVNGNSIWGNDKRGGFLGNPLPLGCCDGFIATFDPQTGKLDKSITVPAQFGSPVLPDGRIVVLPKHDDGEVGPVVAWNPDDNSMTPLVGCRAVDEDDQFTCVDEDESWLDAESFWVDPTDTSLLMVTSGGDILRFDANTLQLRDRRSLNNGIEDVDGYGAGVIVVGGTLIDEITLEPIGDVSGNEPLEFNHDASLIAVHDDPGQITLYDTTSWQPVRSFGAGESRIRGLEFSNDGTMLASGGTDGFLRVWEVETGRELHRVPIESPSDAFWLDDDHLAVGTSFGFWTTISLDLDELVSIATSRLTRGFSEEECTTYRVNPCPTLDEVKGR